ncbi:MAG TPA: hypothetical protein VLF14_02890 [Candidatus Binatia bacterium]|nr:hypothetical protein [Candidatus Binatia bacterium]
MDRSERNATDSSTEARARFREAGEQLAVRLRWLSIVAIPMLAYLSGRPIRSPWFELLVASAGIYNLVVKKALAAGRRGPALSTGTGSLAIEDDGSGLNGNRTGIGLRPMRERVEALGGRLEIQSIQGAGTRISAWVPEASAGESNGDSSLSR